MTVIADPSEPRAGILTWDYREQPDPGQPANPCGLCHSERIGAT